MCLCEATNRDACLTIRRYGVYGGDYTAYMAIAETAIGSWFAAKLCSPEAWILLW